MYTDLRSKTNLLEREQNVSTKYIGLFFMQICFETVKISSLKFTSQSLRFCTTYTKSIIFVFYTDICVLMFSLCVCTSKLSVWLFITNSIRLTWYLNTQNNAYFSIDTSDVFLSIYTPIYLWKKSFFYHQYTCFNV